MTVPKTGYIPIGIDMQFLLNPEGQPARLADAHGIAYETHKAICEQYCLWWGLSPGIWLSVVCGSHDDCEPVRARDWKHYLKGIGLI